MADVAAPAAPTSTPATPAAPAQGGGRTEQAPNTQAGASPVKQPEAQAPKVFERKVNGKMVKFTEEQLLAKAGLAEAAEQRFSEAAEIRKKAEAVIGRIRNPEQMMDALMDPALGLNKEQIKAQFEAWYEREFIEPEKLTEDQKKLREAERRIKQYADKEQKQEEARTAAERDELTAKARGDLQQQIIDACETGGLPKTNFTARRLAYWMQRNLQNGFNAPTSLLVSQVRNELHTAIRDIVESSDGEALIQALGEPLIQKVRRYDLDQLRKLRGGGVQPPADTTTPETTRESKRSLSSADVTQKLRELQRTGRY